MWPRLLWRSRRSPLSIGEKYCMKTILYVAQAIVKKSALPLEYRCVYTCVCHMCMSHVYVHVHARVCVGNFFPSKRSPLFPLIICAYTRVCMYIWMHVCIKATVCTCIYGCTCVYRPLYVHAHMDARASIYGCTCVYSTCIFTCMWLSIGKCEHVLSHVHAYMDARACIYGCMWLSIGKCENVVSHVYIQKYTNIRIHIFVYFCIYTHMCIYSYMYIHICTYILVYMHTKLSTPP